MYLNCYTSDQLSHREWTFAVDIADLLRLRWQIVANRSIIVLIEDTFESCAWFDLSGGTVPMKHAFHGRLAESTT